MKIKQCSCLWHPLIWSLGHKFLQDMDFSFWLMKLKCCAMPMDYAISVTVIHNNYNEISPALLMP